MAITDVEDFLEGQGSSGPRLGDTSPPPASRPVGTAELPAGKSRFEATQDTIKKMQELGFDVKARQPVNGQQEDEAKKMRGEGMPMSHVITFTGFGAQLGRVYRNPDEAWRHSRENARNMRNDLCIMECLEARQGPIATFPWHLESTNDPIGKELVKTMTEVIELIPRFTEYRRVLQEAIWYGRYAIQHNYGIKNVSGKRMVTLIDDPLEMAWSPINGDKLAFPIDRQGIGIRIGWSALPDAQFQKFKNADNEEFGWYGGRVRKVEITTEYGRVYWLDEDELDRVNLHKHMVEDADYETPLQAGRIHGVGIRDRIYWTWYQKLNTAALLMEYLERSALGFEIWTYPMGDAAALDAVEQAAFQRVGFGKNIVFVPVLAGQEDVISFQHQETGLGGIELFNTLIHEYWELQIKRFILGQQLSSEPQGGGLGSSGIADLQKDTYQTKLIYDARNAESSMTRGLVEPLRRRNTHILPIGSEGYPLNFKINTEDDDPKEFMEGVKVAYEIRLPMKEDDLYDKLGLSKPDEGDKILLAPDPSTMMGMMGQGGGGPSGQPGAAPGAGGGPTGQGGKSAQDVAGLAKFAAGWDEALHPRGQPENAGEFATAAGQHAATSKHVKIADNGQVALTRPSTVEDANTMLTSILGIHAAAMKQYESTRDLPDNHPLRVHALLVASHVTRQMKRASSMVRPLLAATQDKEHYHGLEHVTPAVQQALDDIATQYPPANPDGWDTLTRFKTNAGKWTAERQRLHNQIADKLLAGVPKSMTPTFTMMGGGPASGKSRMIQGGVIDTANKVNLDVDSVKTSLPEYGAMVKGGDTRSAAYAHEESSYIGRRIVSQAFRNSQDVLLDSTGDGHELSDLRAKCDSAHKAGYRVNGEYATCSLATAIQRNLDRAKKTGRLAPPEMLTEVHRNISKILPEAIKQGLFDNLRLCDTETIGAPPVLVAEAKGPSLAVYDGPRWANFLQKANG